MIVMSNKQGVVPIEEREKYVLSGAAESFLAQPQVNSYNVALQDHALKIRDSKLGNPEVVEQRINEYFDLCSEHAQLPSIKALSLYIAFFAFFQ